MPISNPVLEVWRDNVERLWERLTRESRWFNETRFTRFQANADAILINLFLDTGFDESVVYRKSVLVEKEEYWFHY